MTVEECKQKWPTETKRCSKRQLVQDLLNAGIDGYCNSISPYFVFSLKYNDISSARLKLILHDKERFYDFV